MVQYGMFEAKIQTFLLQKSSTAENDKKQLYSQVLLSHGARFWQVDLTAEWVNKILYV